MITLDGVGHRFRNRLPNNADKSPQYILIRLLLGTSTISDARSECALTHDYSSVPPVEQFKSGAEALRTFLATDVGCSQSEFIRRTVADNRKFFREILAEFCQYFLQVQRGSHLSAFVCLYRLMEKVAFSVPLLYSSTMTDFSKTFDEMRKYFSGASGGEISFFKKFVGTGRLVDNQILDVVLPISLSSQSGFRGNYFKILNDLYDRFEVVDESSHTFDIKFRNLADLLVCLRNRFLHSLSGDWRNNIASIDICDPDEFFGQINPLFCSYLANVVLQCLAKKYQV